MTLWRISLSSGSLRMFQRSGRRLAGVSMVAALALMAAACSASGSSGDASSSGSPVAGGHDYDVAAARAAVQKLETRPTTIGITAPIKGTVPSGKHIDYLQCPVPAC